MSDVELRPNKFAKKRKKYFLLFAAHRSVRHRVSPISTSYSSNLLASKSGVTSYCIFLLSENIHTWVNAKKYSKYKYKNIAFEFRTKFIRNYCRWSKCIRIIRLLWIYFLCSHAGVHKKRSVGIGCVASVTISKYAHVIWALYRQRICT